MNDPSVGERALARPVSRRTLLTGTLALVAGGSVVGLSPTAAHAGTISYQFQTQATGSWCSAASARVALTARGLSPTQSELASQLGLSGDNGLPDISNLPSVLNSRLGATRYTVRSYGSATSYRSGLDADIRASVDRGYAVILNTWYYTQGSGTVRSNSGHYLTVVGYNSSSQYYVADPASYLNDPGRWWPVATVLGWQKLYRYVTAYNFGTSTPATWTSVQVGSTGFRVTALQYLLRHRGYTITVDGNFGNATKSTVVAFQRAQGLTQDGVVGNQTWPRVIVSVQQGSSGNATRAAQTALNAYGFGLTVDGNFGSVTKTAAMAFQRSKGLTQDGLVGPQTWAALI